MNILFVFFGGAIGALLRFEVSQLWNGKSSFPLGTFFANISGGILLGLLINFYESSGFSESIWLLLATGFCGGYTTYSTFSFEVFQLLKQGKWKEAFLYLSTSVLTTIFAIWVIFQL
ncbi:fluoride efflux transporter CrcB [Halobacillus mangrovi]|uniref:fluoride efflux transporter CrcB n=1 Tax=Halobacillus mangrovi TaxID=402384 RepID=UPI003D96CEDD